MNTVSAPTARRCEEPAVMRPAPPTQAVRFRWRSGGGGGGRSGSHRRDGARPASFSLAVVAIGRSFRGGHHAEQPTSAALAPSGGPESILPRRAAPRPSARADVQHPPARRGSSSWLGSRQARGGGRLGAGGWSAPASRSSSRRPARPAPAAGAPDSTLVVSVLASAPSADAEPLSAAAASGAARCVSVRSRPCPPPPSRRPSSSGALGRGRGPAAERDARRHADSTSRTCASTPARAARSTSASQARASQAGGRRAGGGPGPCCCARVWQPGDSSGPRRTASSAVMLFAVGLARDLRHERIVGVRIRRSDRTESSTFEIVGARAPLALQNVEANAAVAVHVAPVDLRRELHLRRADMGSRWGS